MPSSMRKNLVFIAIVVAIIALGTLWNSKGDLSSWGRKDTSWYAVYLTNNQVYFGHISSMGEDKMVLEDVHFAEAYQEPVQASTSKNFALAQEPKQTFRIMQRGNEKMLASDHKLYINRISVLYWEKFSPDAEVVKLLEGTK